MSLFSDDTRAFLKSAWTRPLDIGAIAPSSEAICRLMLDGLDFADDHGVVIELGCGTGALTRQIDKRITHPERYLGIERHDEFVEHLDEQFPRLRFACADAEHLSDELRRAGLDDRPVLAVLSTLPLSSLDDEVQARLIDAIDAVMLPGVVFRSIQCLTNWPMPKSVAFRRRMAERFGAHTRLGPVLLNVPPACVLSWQRD